ncbi:MAG: endolytic transglycosylase MltG [Patescibacteria group bacterium]
MKQFPIFKVAIGLFVAFFLFSGYGLGIILPPIPINTEPVLIKRGATAEDIAISLKKQNIIRSKHFFVWAVYIGGIENRLAAGKFIFSEPMSLFNVIRLVSAPQKETMILVPEGADSVDIKESLARNNMPASASFLQTVKKYKPEGHLFISSIPREKTIEGFLFPDTYRFYEYADATEIIDTMVENFSIKIEPLLPEVASSSKSLYDIIILASILEREVQTPEDKAVVAGILEARLEKKMLLQVDATLAYEIGKGSKDLTLDDLARDTPFNTYVHKGLPPGPIGNPGLEAIKAVLHPTPSPYLFYLSDKEGVTHYARTFDEHKKNKAKYLAN